MSVLVGVSCAGTGDGGARDGFGEPAAVEDSPAVEVGAAEGEAGPAAGDSGVSGESGVAAGGGEGALGAGGAGEVVSGGEVVSLSVALSSWCALFSSGGVKCSGGWPERDRLLVGEFVSVAVGFRFGCAVRGGGELVCWGTAGGGGSEPPAGSFKAVAAGDGHACAVRADGGLVCWGRDGFNDFDWAGADLPVGEFTSVSTGAYHACAIRVGGEVACWGNPVFGQGRQWAPPGRFTLIASGGHSWAPKEFSCGVQVIGGVSCWRGGDDVVRLSPGGSPGDFVSIDVAWNYVCGVRGDGSLQCWGQRTPGECTPDIISSGSVGGLKCWGWDAYPGSAPGGPFTAVGLSWWSHEVYPAQICAARLGGAVVCWNDSGVPLSLPPAGEFTALEVSRSLSCGLGPDGAATCWGALDHDEYRPAPRWRPAEGAFVSLSVGAGHACGLRADGEVACWGVDVFGETRAPGGAFSSVSAGRNLSCGLRPGGEAECWGTNQWWEAAPPPGRFEAVYAADSYACGLRPGGGAECWGRGADAGELDLPGEFVALDLELGCGLRPGGEVACWNGGDAVAELLPAGPFNAIDGEWLSGCGLRPGGEVACWGDFAGWEPPGTFEAFSVAASGVCGIRGDHTVDCRRDETQPASRLIVGDAVSVLQTPDNTVGPRADWLRAVEPAGVPGSLAWVLELLPAGPFTGLAGGGLCGIRPDGRLDCWAGTGERARLDGAGYRSVAHGHGYWCALTAGDELHCAGGDVWDSPSGAQWGAAHPPPPGRFADVAVGIERACAVPLGGGEITCWGPAAGQDRHTPPAGSYTAVSIGESHDRAISRVPTYTQHTCALRADGEVVCWGDDGAGRTRVPPERLAAAPYRAVAAGGEHSCALRAGGEIICWGDNQHGQTDAPGGVHTAITAGRWHTCALRAHGEAVCWGDGVTADKGERYYTQPPPGTPHLAPPPGPFTAISAGPYHTCALRPNGDPACWLNY